MPKDQKVKINNQNQNNNYLLYSKISKISKDQKVKVKNQYHNNLVWGCYFMINASSQYKVILNRDLFHHKDTFILHYFTNEYYNLIY